MNHLNWTSRKGKPATPAHCKHDGDWSHRTFGNEYELASRTIGRVAHVDDPESMGRESDSTSLRPRKRSAESEVKIAPSESNW